MLGAAGRHEETRLARSRSGGRAGPCPHPHRNVDGEPGDAQRRARRSRRNGAGQGRRRDRDRRLRSAGARGPRSAADAGRFLGATDAFLAVRLRPRRNRRPRAGRRSVPGPGRSPSAQAAAAGAAAGCGRSRLVPGGCAREGRGARRRSGRWPGRHLALRSRHARRQLRSAGAPAELGGGGGGEPAAAPSFNPRPLGAAAASLDQILGRGPATPIGQPLVDMLKQQGGGASNIDHVQPLNVAYNAPAVRSEPRKPTLEAKTPNTPSTDPFGDFDPFASLVGRKPAEPIAPLEETPERQPREEEFAPPTPPAPAAQPASAAATTSAAAAFLEGAGLAHLQISEADADKFLRESGTIVRACVEGLIGLLMARSELKKEMRAEDRTMVASRDNNPLKLMTEPREALSYLFDSRERLSGAFLPPVQAVGDACDDLRVHEIALMAGMRAAFQGALKRFDPQLIEREADKQKGSFSLNKKVKLWDAFVAHHEKLTRDAEDDLLKVFGKEFLGTYMAQVRRLRSGPKH